MKTNLTENTEAQKDYVCDFSKEGLPDKTQNTQLSFNFR